MLTNDIMKAVINQAVKNGYKRLEMWGDIIEVVLSDDYCMITYQDGDGETIPTFALIYSHDFAKAFWGEDRWCYFLEGDIVGECLNQEEYEAKESENNHWESFKPYWEYQLQCMVVQDDPVAYLEYFIGKAR